MKRFARALVVMLGLAVFGSVVSLVPQKPAAGAGSAPVNITSPIPLPVTGNVNATVNGAVGITGTPNVNVANTPNVNIGSLPAVQLGSGSTVGITGPVQVGNDAANPAVVRDVDNPARQPFQKTICIAFGSFTLQCTGLGLGLGFQVPATQRLVIEQVSGNCEQGAGSPVGTVPLRTQVGSDFVDHIFPLQPTPIFAAPTAVYSSSFNQVTRIYADPNSGVGFSGLQFAAFGTGIDALCKVSVSGYLLNP